MSTERTPRIQKRSRLHVVYYDVPADVRLEWKTQPDRSMTCEELVKSLKRIIEVLEK